MYKSSSTIEFLLILTLCTNLFIDRVKEKGYTLDREIPGEMFSSQVSIVVENCLPLKEDMFVKNVLSSVAEHLGASLQSILYWNAEAADLNVDLQTTNATRNNEKYTLSYLYFTTRECATDAFVVHTCA